MQCTTSVGNFWYFHNNPWWGKLIVVTWQQFQICGFYYHTVYFIGLFGPPSCSKSTIPFYIILVYFRNILKYSGEILFILAIAYTLSKIKCRSFAQQ